jgi:hypothetical protein
MPRNAVGRIPNRATRNRPKIRPFTITPAPRKADRPRSPYNGREESGDGKRGRVSLPSGLAPNPGKIAAKAPAANRKRR